MNNVGSHHGRPANGDVFQISARSNSTGGGLTGILTEDMQWSDHHTPNLTDAILETDLFLVRTNIDLFARA